MKQFNALFGTAYPTGLDASGIELFCMKREGGKDEALWRAWKLLKACTERELAEANMRSLFLEEVCLDCEDPLTANAAICKLMQQSLEFFAWNSGSRGLHVSIFFKEMAAMPDEDRAKIRKAFAQEYKTDTAKGSARTLIQLENRLHWKQTGNPKTLLTQTQGDSLNNKLPECFVEMLHQSATKSPIQLSEAEDTDLSAAWLAEVWRKNPRVLEKVKVLQSDAQPADRSGKDFVIIKCLLEQGARKLPIYRFLRTLKQSKVQTDGWSYFHYTYEQIVKRLYLQ